MRRRSNRPRSMREEAADRLRIQVAIEYATWKTGSTVYALGTSIKSGKEGSVFARQLAYCKRGERYPSGEDISTDKIFYNRETPRPKDSILEQLETQAEGVLWWWDHVLWTALRHPMAFTTSQQTILSGVSQLPKKFQSLLIRTDKYNSTCQYLHCTKSTGRKLATLPPFDALAAALFIGYQAEAIHQPRLRRMAVWLYHKLGPKLRKLPPLAPFADELLILVHMNCPSWLFDRNNLAQRHIVPCPYHPRPVDLKRLVDASMHQEAPVGMARYLPCCPALENKWQTKKLEITITTAGW